MVEICSCCAAARISPAYPSHSPACLHCGARLIQALGGIGRPKDEIIARRRAVLATWVAHGHAETELRELAKNGAVPLQAPINPKGQ